MNKNEEKNGITLRLSSSARRELIDLIHEHYRGTLRHQEPMILDGLIQDMRLPTFRFVEHSHHGLPANPDAVIGSFSNPKEVTDAGAR